MGERGNRNLTDDSADTVEALKATKEMQISSMFTLFAEFEVTSLVAKGGDRQDIALGLHLSVVRRAASMLKRVSNKEAFYIQKVPTSYLSKLLSLVTISKLFWFAWAISSLSNGSL